ncbi:hypothetical protein E2542_SST27962 [Spatholobus suberectus]|nr:hypothetical protein E2542_SST27962 [Spatholobus suberectus]
MDKCMINSNVGLEVVDWANQVAEEAQEEEDDAQMAVGEKRDLVVEDGDAAVVAGERKDPVAAAVVDARTHVAVALVVLAADPVVQAEDPAAPGVQAEEDARGGGGGGGNSCFPIQTDALFGSKIYLLRLSTTSVPDPVEASRLSTQTYGF